MLTIRGLRRGGLDGLELGPVDLDLPAGDCVAVTGPSGSGKSLFLRAIADLDLSQGVVELGGRRREAMPAPVWRRLVTYVAAESGWWADAVGAHFPDWDVAAPVVEALLLPRDVHEWPVSRLSTGERQRLGLARALVGPARVLLLDEPTSGLDGKAVAAVEALLRIRRREGTAILLVTHDPEQARRHADRALRFAAGKALEEAL